MANSGVIIGSTIAGVAIIFAIFISLNPITYDSESEWQDMLPDKNDTQDVIIENKDEFKYRKNLVSNAMKILNPREKEIIKLRRLSEKPKKLEELSQKFNISRERVRQIEEKAFEKLQQEVSNTI